MFALMFIGYTAIIDHSTKYYELDYSEKSLQVLKKCLVCS